MNEIAQEHYARFQHNVALAQRIIKTLPADSDWSCVAMFYAALHLITAYLAAKHNVSFDDKPKKSCSKESRLTKGH
jgi:hypothetical protein